MSCPQRNNNMGAGNGTVSFANPVLTPQTQNVIDLTGLEEGCSQVSTQALPDLNGLQQAVKEVEAMKEQAKSCFTKADLQTLMEESPSLGNADEKENLFRWMPHLTEEQQTGLVQDVDGVQLTPIPPPMEPFEEEHLGNFRLDNEYVPQLFPQKEYQGLKRKCYTMGWEETELYEDLLEEALAQREMLHNGYVPDRLTIEQSEFDQVQDAAAREAVMKVTAEYLSMEDLLDEVST